MINRLTGSIRMDFITIWEELERLKKENERLIKIFNKYNTRVKDLNEIVRPCEFCKGTGKRRGDSPKVLVMYEDSQGKIKADITNTCKACGGSGLVWARQEILNNESEEE